MITACRQRLRTMVAAAMVLGLAGAPVATAGDVSSAARNVIQSMWDTVIPILANKGLDRAPREARFGAIYRAHFDNAGIAAAVAGAAWQRATPEQRAQFLRLFEAYVVKVYAGQLASYNGEQLLIRSSEPDGDGALVTSQIVDPGAKAQRSIELKWRLRMTAQGLKVRDVLFENISMTLNQRREFASVLYRRGGTLEGLTTALQEKLAQLDRPK